MTTTLAAKNLSLYDLETRFNLALSEDEEFFLELKENLPEISPEEKRALDRVKRNYINTSKRRPMLEDLVKMVVLSPLLDLADFWCDPELDITTEVDFWRSARATSLSLSLPGRATMVEISLEDEGEKIKGYMVLLSVKEKLWLLAIESKRTQVDVMSALPQILFYMLNSPNLERPTFGLIANGREFVFVKLIQNIVPKYAYSQAFNIQARGNELYEVLRILKGCISSLPATAENNLTINKTES